MSYQSIFRISNMEECEPTFGIPLPFSFSSLSLPSNLLPFPTFPSSSLRSSAPVNLASESAGAL